MTLRDDLETEIMFSELRCKKILPSAMAAYREGLPQHYTTEYHQVPAQSLPSLTTSTTRPSCWPPSLCTHSRRAAPPARSWQRCWRPSAWPTGR